MTEDSSCSLFLRGEKIHLLDCEECHEDHSSVFEWRDSGVWLDRFDGRLLLEDLGERRGEEKKGAIAMQEEEEESDPEFEKDELFFERYHDMSTISEENIATLLTPLVEQQDDDDDYDDKNRMTSHLDVYGETVEPFDMPNHEFPTDVKHFPDTMKQYDIIMHTVNAIRNNPQLEIMVKVRQQGNPRFYFLEDDPLSRCNLYPLYKYLRDLNDAEFWKLYVGIKDVASCDEEISIVTSEEGLSSGNNNALSLLGEYVESEDEEDKKINERKPSVLSNANNKATEDEDKNNTQLFGASTLSQCISDKDGNGGDDDKMIDSDCDADFWDQIKKEKVDLEGTSSQADENGEQEKKKEQQKKRLQKAKLLSNYFKRRSLHEGTSSTLEMSDSSLYHGALSTKPNESLPTDIPTAASGDVLKRDSAERRATSSGDFGEERQKRMNAKSLLVNKCECDDIKSLSCQQLFAINRDNVRRKVKELLSSYCEQYTCVADRHIVSSGSSKRKKRKIGVDPSISYTSTQEIVKDRASMREEVRKLLSSTP